MVLAKSRKIRIKVRNRTQSDGAGRPHGEREREIGKREQAEFAR